MALARSPNHYSGKPVRCMLTPRYYRLDPDGIVWVDGSPGLPDLLFRVAEPPPDDQSPLDVSGTCAGVVAGRVVVANCAVIVIPRTLPWTAAPAPAR